MRLNSMPHNETIRISRIHHPLHSLGPGTRIGIWLQGCTLACDGCMSKHTWSKESGQNYSQQEVLKKIENIYLESNSKVDGITFSGGEPFEQGGAFLGLVEHIKLWRDQTQPSLDLLCYTGFRWASIRKRFPSALDLFDGIISEPYSKNDNNNSQIMGSSNQLLHHLTPLGKEMYNDEWQALTDRKIDIVVDNNSVSVLGIPNQGDLDKLVNLCKSKGLTLEGLSWS